MGSTGKMGIMGKVMDSCRRQKNMRLEVEVYLFQALFIEKTFLSPIKLSWCFCQKPIDIIYACPLLEGLLHFLDRFLLMPAPHRLMAAL